MVNVQIISEQNHLLNNRVYFIYKLLQKFCKAFERDDWLNDVRLKTNNARIPEREWFLPAVHEMIGKYDLDDVLARCAQAEVPYSPIARPEDLFDDAQLNQGDSLIGVTLPNGDVTKLPRLPFRLEGQENDADANLPEIGEHTQEILKELGLE